MTHHAYWSYSTTSGWLRARDWSDHEMSPSSATSGSGLLTILGACWLHRSPQLIPADTKCLKKKSTYNSLCMLAFAAIWSCWFTCAMYGLDSYPVWHCNTEQSSQMWRTVLADDSIHDYTVYTLDATDLGSTTRLNNRQYGKKTRSWRRYLWKMDATAAHDVHLPLHCQALSENEIWVQWGPHKWDGI